MKDTNLTPSQQLSVRRAYKNKLHLVADSQIVSYLVCSSITYNLINNILQVIISETCLIVCIAKDFKYFKHDRKKSPGETYANLKISIKKTVKNYQNII